MDIGSLLLALALILLVIAFVARPVVAPSRRATESAPPDAGDLVAQREAVLVELRDLDFDHTIGKIDDQDHAAQRARLVARGAALLRALDQQPADAALNPASDPDAEIERLVLARRKRPQAPGAKKSAAHPARCPHCRRPISLDDKFCPHCGTRQVVAEATK
jgi:hypothetical protein